MSTLYCAYSIFSYYTIAASSDNVSNKHISNIELGKAKPSLEALVHIANALEISTDDLLVDSLKCSASTADSELHRLLLDCNPVEEEILTRMVKELKAIVYGLGI